MRKRIQLVITREKVPLTREVEEGRTLVRLNLHIHSGNSGLSSLNAKDPMETVKRTFGLMIRSQKTQ